MEAAEGQKFSAASRRAIEIVMVMNSQPTLHDSKPMLCRGILLLLNTKKYLRAPQIAPHIPGAMQRKVHFCTQRNWETTAWFALCVLENSGIICSILTTERGMVEFSERTQANMDVVLEEVCAELPNGGDHESRKFIAEQLIQCARSGRTTLGELMYAARRAIVQLERNQRSAS
jgi:hypothetical protein